MRKARSRYHLCRGHGPCHTSGHKLEKSNASQCSPHTAHISLTTANRFQSTSFCTTAPAGRAWSASRRWDWWPHATPRHELAIFRGAFTTAAPQLAQPSRRRVYHFAAPPSTFIRRFNRGGEGMSAKSQSRRRLAQAVQPPRQPQRANAAAASAGSAHRLERRAERRAEVVAVALERVVARGRPLRRQRCEQPGELGQGRVDIAEAERVAETVRAVLRGLAREDPGG